MNDQRKLSLYSVLLYLCGLFLFLEWLYPIEQVTDTSSISIFLLFTVYCFLISLLQLKWWTSFLLKGFGMLFILNGLYVDDSFFSLGWISEIIAETYMNGEILISQNWYYLTPMFRSLLFLLLIWLMSYLLYYWFVQMKRIFLFIVLTFVYIGVLDTFTMYDATFPIIRIFVISFAALAITNFNREMEKEKIPLSRVRRKAWWVLPLTAVIGFSVLLGMSAPKFGPQWPDPVPFIESAAEQVGSSGGSGIRKVGYGEDDSQLGGSFIQDDTPVFRAKAEDEQYWRIETKDLYTGRGWENSNDPVFIEQPEGEIALLTFFPEVETEERHAEIEFLDGQNFEKLVYPYGTRKITDMSPNGQLFIEQWRESLETRNGEERVQLNRYEVIFNEPSFSLNELREDNPAAEPQWEDSNYLQLPDHLPERIGELAEEVTDTYDTRYDKVRAVERYFSTNDFTYQTTGVPVPEEDEDYVDQFLFETQLGYCDNFSTAMVVMLRTLDIPARWVKGFTAGEMIEEGENGEHHVYEVTNSHAHSWVEVFFPETGWVSFEPTQGFTNLAEFHVDTPERDGEMQDDILDASERELPEPEPGMEEDEAEPAMAQASGGNMNIPWWQIGLIALVLLIIGYILFKYRLHLLSMFHSVRMNYAKDERAFQEAYHHLLRVLDREGYARKQDQTLREFAKRIDTRYRTEEMQVLTGYYERMLYRNEFDPADTKKLKSWWKKLLQTILG
jgi:transglutaminase-like putative cysteine protease